MAFAAAEALAREPFDRTKLLVVPAALFMLLLFIYPFLYGLWLSFAPKEGGALANYRHFFTTDNLYPTIWTTLRLALPATLINVGFALPIALALTLKPTNAAVASAGMSSLSTFSANSVNW